MNKSCKSCHQSSSFADTNSSEAFWVHNASSAKSISFAASLSASQGKLSELFGSTREPWPVKPLLEVNPARPQKSPLLHSTNSGLNQGIGHRLAISSLTILSLRKSMKSFEWFSTHQKDLTTPSDNIVQKRESLLGMHFLQDCLVPARKTCIPHTYVYYACLRNFESTKSSLHISLVDKPVVIIMASAINDNIIISCPLPRW